MRFLFFLLGLFSTQLMAQEFKVFWRCADNHLEAVEPQSNYKGRAIDLYINYAKKNDALNYSAINKQSMVELPQDLQHGDYLMLGDKGEWLMNCVGQIVVSEHYPYPKVVFDVQKNAFSCPLIPADCAEKKDLVLVDY